MRRPFCHPKQYGTPHHHLGQLSRRGVLRYRRPDDLAATHHGDLVSHGHDLAELVRDKNHGRPFPDQPADNVEEAVGFLWGEGCGRLVED